MYEDYMQNILEGSYYPYQNTYEQNFRDYGYCNQVEDFYNIPQNIYNRNNFGYTFIVDADDLYPEIYKIIYPMIKKACRKIAKPIDEGLVEDITREIYNNLEAENIVNINISVDNVENRSNSTPPTVKQTSTLENRSSGSRKFNPIKDLIKILLIRELFGSQRPSFPNPRPPRPPFPGSNPRPPMPPRPRF